MVTAEDNLAIICKVSTGYTTVVHITEGTVAFMPFMNYILCMRDVTW